LIETRFGVGYAGFLFSTALMLKFIVLIVLAIANLGGTASWTTDVAKVGGWFALLEA
jgi:hypothetical protein